VAIAPVNRSWRDNDGDDGGDVCWMLELYPELDLSAALRKREVM
jgi:hypothetical protein